MDKIALPILLFLASPSFCQNLILSGGLGMTEGERKGSKDFMFGKSLSGGYEFELNWSISLIPSLEYKQVHSSRDNAAGQNVFSKNNFLALPVVLRKYFNAGKARLFFDAGLYGSYFYSINEKVRDEASPLLRFKKKDIGFSLGIISEFGFKRNLDNRQSFDIGIKSENDLTADKKNINWLKSASLSLVLSYYWAFK